MLALAGTGRPARAAALLVQGGADLARIEGDGVALDSQQRVGWSGGLSAGFDMGRRAGWDLGLLWLNRVHESGGLESRRSYLALPLLLRARFGDRVSLGVGAYGAFGIGTRWAGAGAAERLDFGAVGSMAFQAPISARFALLLEARYLYGLRDLEFTAEGSGWRDVQLLAGLRFELSR
jgi:hypothetical protein